jgi:hypothetical protein
MRGSNVAGSVQMPSEVSLDDTKSKSAAPKPLPNLPNAVQLTSETPDSADTMGWFNAARIRS